VNKPLDVKDNDEIVNDFALHLSRLFSVSASLDFPCTAHTFFPELLPNHLQKIVCNSLVGFIAKLHQARYTAYKISSSNQRRGVVYTDPLDMLVLSSTVASRYYNCCTDGNTSS
jgi:hypothetical protein